MKRFGFAAVWLAGFVLATGPSQAGYAEGRASPAAPVVNDSTDAILPPIPTLAPRAGQFREAAALPRVMKGGRSSASAGRQAPARRDLTGLASWYGPGFHGRKTASGERFNQGKLTAAHRTLPMGTKVRVINEENGRSIVVTVNDRGPFIKGRVIDVSKRAAELLEFKEDGVAKVRLEILQPVIASASDARV